MADSVVTEQTLAVWPSPPEGYSSFMVLIFPRWPKGATGEERIPARRVRLKSLTLSELDWVADTLAVEYERRKSRASSS